MVGSAGGGDTPISGHPGAASVNPPHAPGFFSKVRGAQFGVHYAVNDCECQRSDQGSRRSWFRYRVLVHSARLDLSRSVHLPTWPAGDVARFDLTAPGGGFSMPAT